MSIRRLARAGIGVLALAGVSSGLWLATPSFAFEAYTLRAHLGGVGAGNGQFKGPAGVAVNDTTGNLYVADSGNNRVQELTPAGAYITQFNGGSEHTLAGPAYIAVDNSAGPAKGDVYVFDSGHGVLDVFDGEGKYLRQIPIEHYEFIGGVQGIAVDASGNVWVARENAHVEEFSDTGVPVINVHLPYSGLESGFAVDSQGNIYVQERSEGIIKLNAKFEQLYYLQGNTGRPTAFTVDPATENIFVDQGAPREGSPRIVECASFAEPPSCEVDTFGELEGFSGSAGIAVDGSGDVFASESTTGELAVFMFVLLADVHTGPVGGVERTSATVMGTVKRDGKPATYDVQYGEGKSLASSTTPVNISGEAEEEVSVPLTKLKAGTTYSYRFDTENENGTNYGQVQMFTTPPAVEGLSTGPASNVTVTSAKLSGALEPNGFDTHYHFEYGESTGYGLLSPPLPGTDAGSVSGPVPAGGEVVGLIPNTTYHFRLAGENTFGATDGQDETFTTLKTTPVVGVLAASDVGPQGAVLNATVNPEHSGDTRCHILFGTSTSYGANIPAEGIDLGTGSVELAVVKTVEGLAPGTTYHYAVIATNPQGTVQSADETFTTPAVTPPAAQTGAASAVTQTMAAISGTVNPEGLDTRYEFDLGTDTTYGSRMFGDAGSGTAPETFTLSLQDLMPGVTYHYRVAATNVYGTSYGADQTFTTPGFPTSLITAPLTTVLVPTPAFQPFSTTGAGTPESSTKPKQKQRKKKRKGRKAGKGRKAAHAAGRHGNGRGLR